MDIRANRGALLALGVGGTLGPGLVAFAVLRLAGLSVGPAGLVGLLLIFIGCFVFSGWAWSGVGRASAAPPGAEPQESHDG